MKTYRFFIFKQILWINLICHHSTSQLIESENEDIEVVRGSGMDGDLMSENSAYVNFENHIIRYEEKLDAMITTFNQLADNINSLINTNKDLWEKQLQITGDELWTGKMKVSIKTEITDTTQQVIDVQEIRCTDNHFPENCHEVYECLNNVYSIMIPNYSEKPFAAVCDLETSNGGWTIVQRRQDGSQNFYKNWTEYVEGFGNMNGEFFIGLEKLHALTTYGKPQELYIILEDFDGTRKYAKYRTFNVESENTGYKLNVGDYSGDAGDSFSHHNGQKFSTKDRDNDESDTSCAQRLKGGWWYDKCYHCNLNGKYLFGKLPSFKKGQGISWGSFRGYEYSLKFVQMMIRPKD